MKTLFYNVINRLLAIFLTLCVVACSSNGSREWPSMQADGLWSDLEEAKKQESPVTDSAQDTDMSSDSSSLPPGQIVISELDITVALAEIERDLPIHIENMTMARDRFEAASPDDRDLHWRGVEIEISRLNELIGRLREIEYQLTFLDDQDAKKRKVEELLTRIGDLIPDKPSSI